jgi:hypothetical protein
LDSSCLRRGNSRLPGNEAIESHFHIPGYIRIIAFIDEDGRGGVWHVKMTHAALASRLVHQLFDWLVTSINWMRRLVRTFGADIELPVRFVAMDEICREKRRVSVRAPSGLLRAR